MPFSESCYSTSSILVHINKHIQPFLADLPFHSRPSSLLYCPLILLTHNSHPGTFCSLQNPYDILVYEQNVDSVEFCWTHTAFYTRPLIFSLFFFRILNLANFLILQILIWFQLLHPIHIHLLSLFYRIDMNSLSLISHHHATFHTNLLNIRGILCIFCI